MSSWIAYHDSTLANLPPSIPTMTTGPPVAQQHQQLHLHVLLQVRVRLHRQLFILMDTSASRRKENITSIR